MPHFPGIRSNRSASKSTLSPPVAKGSVLSLHDSPASLRLVPDCRRASALLSSQGVSGIRFARTVPMYLLRELLASILFFALLFALLGLIALLATAGWNAGRRFLIWS